MTAGVRQEPREADPARTPRRLRLPTLLALLVGGVGVGYRLALLLADAPPTNSDEATMGLAALHIARGDAFPVWFYGQAYMGTLEAYLAAPLVAVAGPSVLVLRLPTLALYALFLLLSWRLTHRLGGDRWYALLVVAVLALGADRVVKNQLIAGGGYPELNPAGAALALLTVGLCAGGPGARLPRWAAWGLVAGVLLWVDPLILPYVVALGVLLLAWRRRELAGRAGAVLAGALLLGAAPMVLDSLRHGRNPLTAVLRASGSDVAAGWAERRHGGLVLGPSLAMGFCSPGHCAPWQLWWAAVFPILLLVAAYAAWRTLRGGVARTGLGHVPFAANATCPRSGDDPAGPSDRRVSAGVRLALLAGAAAVLAAYAVSDAAGRTPIESSRYLSCLAVAVPALLWPLWRTARPLARPLGGLLAGPLGGRRQFGEVAVSGRPGYHHLPGLESIKIAAATATVGRAAAVAVLAGMLGTGASATVDVIRAVPAVHAEADRHRALVDMLGALGVRHVRGGYWTCNRIAFATGEDVVCAVVDDRLRPGFDRLPAYRRAVAADPDAGWVAPDASPLAAQLDRRLGTAPGTLDVVTVDGWRIYLPRR
ncbi:DUF423 domain-containing protein [Micromonospora sp. RP3T]|uniref:DUF423 domain-containing protein n=1 Tax=Micromonospora sp. RP3T TaxID=2135446 RepID=UPI000D168338|nr:DUF423 domain-containing protein [Micromonospora sp. RP3T]PTA43184.1 DUF423 domain-containing protein [Micromonospora sp. RP3T]